MFLSWNATYETLLGTNKPFPRRIPLGEMVEFLVDIWELEGIWFVDKSSALHRREYKVNFMFQLIQASFPSAVI
ncbi:hypothetical protein TSUD_306050 [Trifolium subterraneum]|uniref:Gag1-like clamp domain-containing protein n=1 Tax=Trifolium subterraneum TaxID=3900 RepID=A0A2Z6N278_TRISU|nr:hypothetical protein TSUD_306050 [Trifolium subterraneum]